jgi:hypothetical protein
MIGEESELLSSKPLGGVTENMAERDEGYTKPILELFERLTALNGLVAILDNQLDNFKDSFRQLLEQSGIDPSLAFAGFALGIRNLVESSNQIYSPYFPVGTFIRQGDDYYSEADEVVERWNALSVAQSYEAFETYLRDQASTHYWIFRPSIPRHSLKYVPIMYDQLGAWKALFRENRWNTFSILNLFRAEAPELATVESSNNLGIDLKKWLSILASLRHGITHSDFKVPSHQFRFPHETITNLLSRYFPGVWEDNCYCLSFQRKHAQEAIEIIASYANLVYKSLADTVDIQVDVIQQSG